MDRIARKFQWAAANDQPLLRFRAAPASIVRWLSVAAILLFLSAHTAYAQLSDTCPPMGGQALMPVPTGEGYMGYIVGSTIKATNGDQVQFWCVKSNSGTDYGYLYYNNTTMKYSWMGGCFFAGGQNSPSGQVTLGVVGNRVVVTGFGVQSWFNYAPPVGNMNQTKSDWDFKYNPGTNKLTVAATTTTWNFFPVLVNPVTGQVLRNQFVNAGTVNQAGYPITYNGPGTFDGLVDKNGNKLDPSYVNQNGTGNEPFNAAATSVGGLVDASLMTTEIGGSGSTTDPYVGLLTSLTPGDEFIIDGSGISNPTVTGLAATTAAGGWIVDSYTSNYVIFEDTAAVTFDPLSDISGFEYFSMGSVFGESWFLTSSILESNSLGVLVPVPEPTPMLLLLTGASLMLGLPLARRLRGPAAASDDTSTRS